LEVKYQREKICEYPLLHISTAVQLLSQYVSIYTATSLHPSGICMIHKAPLLTLCWRIHCSQNLALCCEASNPFLGQRWVFSIYKRLNARHNNNPTEPLVLPAMLRNRVTGQTSGSQGAEQEAGLHCLDSLPMLVLICSSSLRSRGRSYVFLGAICRGSCPSPS
jgi:hypothetical protein